jgi:hypothetical protein
MDNVQKTNNGIITGCLHCVISASSYILCTKFVKPNHNEELVSIRRSVCHMSRLRKLLNGYRWHLVTCPEIIPKV